MNTELLHRIEALQVDYTHCIDDGELERWPEMFTDPCLYRIIGRDSVERDLPIGVMRYESVAMLRDRVTATRNAAMFAPRYIRHLLGGTRIVGEREGATEAHTNVAIYQTSPDGDTMLLMTARYLDLVVEDGAGLKFREKDVIYDTFRLPDSVIFPL